MERHPTIPPVTFPATKSHSRRGAIVPLFAILLPVLLILSSFAVNLSYMALTSTELKVATDAAARAGGRAWSEFQDIHSAKQFAQLAAAQNKVAGAPLTLNPADGTGDIEFGFSVRSSNGYGRYQFSKKDASAVESGAEQANSIRINGRRLASSGSGSVSLLLGGVGATTSFEPQVSSTSTQVDRDISLVLDRSGSMVYYENEDLLYEVVTYYYNSGYLYSSERKAALKGYEGSYGSMGGTIYDREFPPFVMYAFGDNGYSELYDYADGINHYNGRSSGWDEWVQSGGSWYIGSSAAIPGGGGAPDFSRWALLEDAVDAFLDVLEVTHQEEQVALATFNSSAALDLGLDKDFSGVRAELPTIIPDGGTSIGEGMQSGMPALLDADARPYAIKTIVVLTDGVNNAGEISPVSVATDLTAANNVVIHTVTFSDGADQAAMQSVANVGNGKHYHADTGEELIDIFEEIANNLPTVITE